MFLEIFHRISTNFREQYDRNYYHNNPYFYLNVLLNVLEKEHIKYPVQFDLAYEQYRKLALSKTQAAVVQAIDVFHCLVTSVGVEDLGNCAATHLLKSKSTSASSSTSTSSSTHQQTQPLMSDTMVNQATHPEAHISTNNSTNQEQSKSPTLPCISSKHTKNELHNR